MRCFHSWVVAPWPLLLSLLLRHDNLVHALTVPRLADLAKQIRNPQLSYQIAVGNKEQPFQMRGLHVQLNHDKAVAANNRGTTGIYPAQLLQAPTYVDTKGEQAVELQNGGWQMVWQPGGSHGHLGCSFVNSQAVQRSSEEGAASLPQGRFFLYHRTWTAETLASERQRRRDIQAQAATYLQDRDDKIQTITDETNTNVGEKVVSYAKAAQSVNKFNQLGYEESLFIPLYDDQVLELAPDCIVSTRGMVYKQNDKKQMVCIGESRVDWLNQNDNNDDEP